MPKFNHDCDLCRYLGTLFDKFDLYICESDKKMPSYLIRNGNEDSAYYSVYLTNEDLKTTKRKIGGLTDDEIIIITMLHSCTSLFLNGLKQI